MPLNCMIFDFDGVVVDSEPVHLAGFSQVLRERGITLTSEDYYGKYLGFDDHDCFEAVFRDHGRSVDQETIRKMTAAKTAFVQQTYAHSIEPLPGVVELIRSAGGAGIPLAVCSGALRNEIELASQAVGVRREFMTIVSAEDVLHGKPDPQGYRMALGRLIELTGRRLEAGKSVVVEDAPAGIEAAKAGGFKVLAVSNSYPADALAGADKIVSSLAQVTLAQLETLI